MSIIQYNTNYHIVNGLVTCLQDTPFRKLSNKDIIMASEISPRTFYRYYADKNDLLDSIENELIGGLKEALEIDRKSLENLQEAPDPSEIVSLADDAFKHTLAFAEKNKAIAKALLSDNGNILFAHQIEEVSEEEFKIRAKFLSGNKQIEVTDPVFIKMYVSQIITLIESWLFFSDEISPRKIREFIGKVQVTSPFDILKLEAEIQEQ